MPHEPPLHDVLIVGGGLVGASLAIALDRTGLDVALLEAAPPGALPAVFDERNLSFSESTVNALSALGVLQKLRVPSGAIERIHITRRGDFGRTVLEASRHGRREFGRVVVARDFGEALEARLAELPRLLRYRPVRFVGCEPMRDPGFREVRIADGGGERIIRTRLLVGADGTRSAVREALGIGADQHDYRQSLFVTRLRAERAPDGTAYERLGDHGPTALLPRGDRHYGLILAVAGEQADAVDALDEAGFLSHAQEAFGWRVGRFLSCGARSVYSAIQVTSRELTAARAVLVGNSAQTIHPVGAQGFNLGLRDALTLAELIHDRRDPTPAADLVDCGSAALLSEYRQRRQEDRQRTLQFSDGVARLSAGPSALIRPLRSLGLLALGHLDSVQSLLVGGALGYRGDVPELCRTAVEPRP
ncbi:MAG: 2-octaprenyl-6-methoxyphenyl hydroxylase [Lysobacter sp.]|nr:2-octaprenyl-6-methoxyphenyl hydroxylase [Lysobacter sp.]MDQ3268974.1 2-octaprenyl-6-methoxyphenyl hydroxylase [Pseudomonadota bacterium]